MAEAPPAADRLTEEYDLLREEGAIVERPQPGIIELAGEDRKGWLQGQATNDVRQLDLGASTRFCLCEPTGQIVGVCEIWSLKDRFILTCPNEARSKVLDRIAAMIVMEDVQVRDITDSFEALCVQGPQASRMLGGVLSLPLLDAAETTLEKVPVITLRADRTGSGGWELLVPVGSKKATAAIRGVFPVVGEATYLAARLEAGIPLYNRDYNEKTLPPELGAAFEANHVDYRKGCYTGQEVLMRIHSRGHTNRTWMGLIADAPLEVGAPVRTAGREVGAVTSAATSPDFGNIGAAMLRNEVAVDRETLDVGGVPAEVRRMPFLRLE